VTPLGIDPETVRLVAQCLNHYASPGPCRDIISLYSKRYRKHNHAMWTELSFCRIRWNPKRLKELPTQRWTIRRAFLVFFRFNTNKCGGRSVITPHSPDHHHHHHHHLHQHQQEDGRICTELCICLLDMGVNLGVSH
jgi:hypothetical protein